MPKLNKKKQDWKDQFYLTESCSIDKAVEIITNNPLEKFNATIDLVFVLNLDLKKPEHLLRGTLKLPFPQQKNLKICVLTEKFLPEAEKAQPFLVGGKELIAEIAKTGKINFDLLLATPEVMPQLNKIAKILGPKKLMPSTKTGTLGVNITQIINDWKKGQSTYSVDTYGNFHLTIGKVQDSPTNLITNFNFCYEQVLKMKPSGVKGQYLKKVFLHTTMGFSFRINVP